MGALKGILKTSQGYQPSKTGRIVFDKTINYILEYDEDLPVLCITDPDYNAPYNDDDDNETSVYWWEEEEDEMQPDCHQEYGVRGYTWNDVTCKSHFQFCNEKVDEIIADFHDSWMEEVEEVVSSDSDVEYEEVTLSDEDSDYQLEHDDSEAGVAVGLQWDPANIEALKAGSGYSQARVYPDEEVVIEVAQHEAGDILKPGLTPPGPENEEPPAPVEAEASDAIEEPPFMIQTEPEPWTEAQAKGKFAEPGQTQEEKSAAPIEAINYSDEADTSQEKKAEATVQVEQKLAKGGSRRPSDKTLPTPTRQRPRRTSSSRSSIKGRHHPARIKSNESLCKEETTDINESSPKSHSSGEDRSKPEGGSGNEYAHANGENRSKPKRESGKKEARGTDEDSSNPQQDRSNMEDHGTDGSKSKPKQRTSVQATQGDIENDDEKIYEWKKPEWTKHSKLKTTKKGRAVRKGANLAKPITMINRAKNDFMDAKLVNKPGWAKRDAVLKQTETGNVLKTGANLSMKITHIGSDEIARQKYGWHKPEWVQRAVVKETAEGEKVKKGENLSKGITHISQDEQAKEKYAWEKPEWAKKKVLKTEIEDGAKLKEGESLLRGITHSNADEEAKEKNGWQKPEWTGLNDLKPTSTAVSKGIDKYSSQRQGRTIEWEKPEWAKKKMVKSTKSGERAKRGENLSRGITHIADDAEVKDKYAWEKPEWAKNKMVRSTPEGEKLKEKGTLERPITFPRGKP